MVQKNDQIKKLTQIGTENEKILPDVKAWCRHLEVQQTSYGLFVEMTGLLAGRLQVQCPHGVVVGESHFLKKEAKDFILKNCIGCSYHQEQSPRNFGRLVLANKEKGEAKAEEQAARRHQLEQEAYSAAEAALQTQEITEKSVNTLILRLEQGQEEASVATARLLEAARLGPELFSDQALQVLADGLQGEQGSAKAAILKAVCQSRGQMPTVVREAAQRAVTAGLDAACALLAEAGRQEDVTPFLPLMLDILAIPDYGMWAWRKPGGYHERPEYAGTLELIGVLLQKAPEAVLQALDERLQVDEKAIKLSTAELLFDLLPEHAEALLTLTRRLIRSLELADDGYERSADVAVCRVLAHLYVFSPVEVEQEIQGRWPFASDEVKVLMLRIYAAVALNDSTEGLGSRRIYPQERYVSHVYTAIERLYAAFADLNFGVDGRREACDLLERVIKRYPAEGIALLDRFIAHLAISIREAENRPRHRGSVMEVLQDDTERLTYRGLIRSVSELITQVVKANPVLSFPKIMAALRELPAEDDRLKAELVDLLGIFGKVYELVPQVIPELYKHLTDFQSNLVRAKAIGVLGEMMAEFPDSIPDNMIELLVVYLEESFVIIHQSALGALRHYSFQRDERGRKALSIILKWEDTYFQQGKEAEFLDTIVRTLYAAYRGWPEVGRHIDLVLLPKHSQHAQPHFAEDSLAQLARRVRKYPELAPKFIQIALDYLKQTSRDQYNIDVHHDRYCIWLELFQVLPEVIAAEAGRFREVIHSKVGWDRIDATRLLEVLSQAGLHKQAAGIVLEARNLLPDVKSHTYERDFYAEVGAAEQAEAAVAAGNPQEAEAVLTRALSPVEDDEE